MSVLIETSFGDMTIDLQTDKFPTACYNFLKLCKLKHYNNALFMNVQKDFVTQIKTSNPTTAWQKLGQSRPFFKDEVDLQAKVNSLGLIGTSNTGPNLNNSEFFITLTKSHLSSLNGKHTVFGKVEEGFDVLKKINQTYVDQKGRPQMNIRIMHTFVLDDPFEDPPNLKQPESPQLLKDPHRLEAIQHLEMLQKYSTEKDIIEATRKEKAKKQAITLEMLGQLPDASIKPPQNILFVCKLNPITQERDLELIFSRFGPIKSVEVVRDWKTGQSLQYAFIQYESAKSCEEAYLKMDNVPIDDRRIKVDFSQSVSKLMPKMKGNQIKTYESSKNKQANSKQIISKMRNHKDYYGDKKYEMVGKDKPKVEERVVNQNAKKLQKSQKKQKKELVQSSSESRSRSREQRKRKKQKKQKKQKKDRKQQRRQRQKRRRRNKSGSSDSRSGSSRSRSNSGNYRRRARDNSYSR